MKNWLVLIALIQVQVAPAQSDHNLKSKIEHVTVYEQGARFERSTRVSLNKGMHKISFHNLPTALDVNSIQVASSEALELVSVQKIYLPLDQIDDSPEIKALEKRLKELSLASDQLKAEKESLELENEFLKQNTQLGGQNGFSLQELQTISTYAREQKLKNQKSQQRIKREQEKIAQETRQISQELSELKQLKKQLSAAILIKVNSPQNQLYHFSIVYSINSLAGWSSKYNLHFKDLDQDLKLSHNAHIYQNTGEDWTNVQLSLVTGAPKQNITVPQIQASYLNFIHPFKTMLNASYGSRAKGQAAPASADAIVMEESNGLISKDFKLQEMVSRSRFEAPQNYSIPNDSEESIKLRELKLKANYSYQSSPLIEAQAYLVAYIQDWEKFQLQNGPMAIYNQGLYLGQSFQDFNSSQDSILISLGQDPSIKIEHERLFSKDGKSFLGSDKIENYEYAIRINNTKSEPIRIRIYDRIPVSQNESISVKHDLNDRGRIIEPKKGIILWELRLDPKEQDRLNFDYQIRYPKDRQIRP